MKRSFAYTMVIVLLLAVVVTPQSRTSQTKQKQSADSTAIRVATGPGSGVAVAAPTMGTPGQIVKFTGEGNAIGDSIITETKLGRIGIGTTTPGSQLSVAGMIETTLGGYKFPDGSSQTTAGLIKVQHDNTLTGDGRSTPLGLLVPTVLFGNVVSNSATGVLTVFNAQPGGASAIVGHGGLASGTTSGGTAFLGFGGSGIATAGGGTGVEGVGGHALDGVDGGRSGKNGGIGGHFVGGSAGNGSGGTGALIEGGTGKGMGHKGGTGILAGPGLGTDGATDGLAADLRGNVTITGNLSKGGGSFKIDHPLDPDNKFLYHSFVESPDMMNIYNGTVTTDDAGEATVTLPDWFEALNQDFRYQLTSIGTFAQAIIAEEINGNRFVVKTSAPNVKVSWQVTGVRHDAYANKHRIPVEEAKSEEERGLLLHPDAFNQPPEKGINFVQNSNLTGKIKAADEPTKRQSSQR